MLVTGCYVFSTEIIHAVVTVCRQFHGHSAEQVLFIIFILHYTNIHNLIFIFIV